MKKLPPRRVLSRVSIAVASLLLAIGGLSLPWHGARPARPPTLLSSARGAGALRSGAAEASIDLPAGAPVGGFARLSFRSDGVRDPVGARALYLEVPGCRVALASVDAVLVTEPLARRVQALVSDLKLDAVLVGATHTHAGPGGYQEDVVWERVGLGPWDARIFDLLAGRIAEAIRRAVAASSPARLSVARGLAPALARARSGGEVDGHVLSLRVEAATGGAIAELFSFAAHPTTLGKANRRISGEWPGSFARAPGRGVRLVLQGAIGDQSARIPPGTASDGPERFAAALLAEDDALVAGPLASEVEVATATMAATLPPPAPGAVPGWLRRAAATLAWNRLPATARITALRVGPALLVLVPGEPTAAVGAAWRAAAGSGAEIVSLVDGYIGYVDTPERTRLGAGEAATTYYGPELSTRLGEAVVAAASASR